jgi:Ca2+-binding RTX toxin-like protein
MSLRRSNFWFSRSKKNRSRVKQRRNRVATLEVLDERITPAVTAFFSAGVLSVFGDSLDNSIAVSRDAAGKLLVNGGAVSVKGGTATVANTAQISIFGQAGNDTLTLNEANGALPRANLFGGAGNDVITGGSGQDLIFGQDGNDTLLGKGGNDLLFGGGGNDTITGGTGDDQAFGESGDDRLIWNPGDGTDLNEGGSGTDTVEVNGGNGDEVFTATANGTRVRFDRTNPAPFSIDIGTSEKLVLNANGGNDSFSATGNLASLIQITVDGGAGDDTLLGSNGNDVLRGGDGNDFVDGQQGNDTVFLGAGDDTFQWDPGDGSDIVEGQDGNDRMVFNGAAINEIFEVSANGGRVRFTRSIGNIVMDLDDVERIDLNALGGSDALTVNNLAGTDLVRIDANLAGAIGGTTGDTAADTITINGTSGDDIINVFGSGTSVSVVGLPTLLNILNSEGANDSLIVSGQGGDDGITTSTLPAGIIKLTLDGGAGNDTLLGSQGADVLKGGDGNDFVFGAGGNDTAYLGAGDDVFQWNPGDGSDTVEGGDGTDRLMFFGANAAETVSVSANGGRVLLSRDIGPVTMDFDDLEQLELRMQGGADNVIVGDLSGTDLTRIDVDLRASTGGGDGAADTITVNGTQGDDTFGAAGDIGGVNVFGLHTAVNIFFQEQANDLLILNGQGGNDVMDAKSLRADAIQLTMNGGLGNDVFFGSEGSDLFVGGDGNDTAFMGAGDDTFVWNPGDDSDILEGQDGFDRMVFNGANIAEKIDISANGERVKFSRDIGSVVMDLNAVEGIDFNALGGPDTVTVNDLSGTDATEVNVNLAGSNGQGDGAADSVVLSGSSGDDVAHVFGDAGFVSVLGLAAQINISGSEAASDKLFFNMQAGDDVVEASALAAGIISLTAHGDDGNDILIGSAAADLLFGDAGDDVLLGGPGQDVLDGGTGDNVVIQD